MKRGAGASGATAAPPAKRPTGHWSQGLLLSISDPSMVVKSDDRVVMIRDKYPKARHHYLVLPQANISSLKALRACHAPLLTHMLQVARDFVSELAAGPRLTFRYGFHAEPSMAGLHMHVVSQDFDSERLKHKKHWNSFTTEFFMDAERIISSLEEKGHVEVFDKAKCDSLRKRPLRCHVCGEEPSNFPKLKAHIKQHTPK